MKDLDYYSLDIVKQKVKDALKTLYQRDYDLIKNDINEQSISYRLAIYLEMQFSEWKYNIDCEYNRNKEDIKENNDAKPFKPDIVIHERKENDNNLLCIEIKKNNDSDDDKIKVINAIENKDYGYKFGMFINIQDNGYDVFLTYKFMCARIEEEFSDA